MSFVQLRTPTSAKNRRSCAATPIYLGLMRHFVGFAPPRLRLAYRFRDRNTIPDEAVTRKIIELANAGESNPDILCEQALRYFDVPLNSRLTVAGGIH